ncbi:hypothetical protein [Paenibacillus senegalensis]|uniref:hypothetical protein n=1 Tax=Paenibacillus senegalensis TaxID=1465766 RepID=UPI00028855C5|nr:hypothetical protein [Paenibacillus senegalensis]
MNNPVSLHFNLAIEHINRGALGAASNLFYRTMLLDSNHYKSWVSLIFCLGIMKDTPAQQVLLARYALRPLPYVKDLIGSALKAYRYQPHALAEWLKIYSEKPECDNKEALETIIADIEQMLARNEEQNSQEKKPPILSIEEISKKKIYLDWIAEKKSEEIFNLVEPMLERPEQMLAGLQILTFFPGLRGEKMLRRVCRNEEASNKAKTRALINLHWHGVKGNAKMTKFGDSFVVNLEKPEPRLEAVLPKGFQALIDWVVVWLAKEQGIATEEDLQAATAGSAAISASLRQQIDATLPPVIQASAESILRETYLHYYPRIPPIVNEIEEWGAAILHILEAFSRNWGQPWKYQVPELNNSATVKREWLLKSLEVKKQEPAGQAAQQSGEPHVSGDEANEQPNEAEASDAIHSAGEQEADSSER